MCTSGCGVELVVGIAGSGKTTALAAARDAFEAEGFEVLGTSTSGQAARTLSREAGIDSRTLASLNWRIAHGSLRLSPRHVAVLDEAAMTDDAALVAFLLDWPPRGAHRNRNFPRASVVAPAPLWAPPCSNSWRRTSGPERGWL